MICLSTRTIFNTSMVMAKIHSLRNEFICKDAHAYKVQIGRTVASSLAGFVAGVILTSIMWGLVVYLEFFAYHV